VKDMYERLRATKKQGNSVRTTTWNPVYEWRRCKRSGEEKKKDKGGKKGGLTGTKLHEATYYLVRGSNGLEEKKKKRKILYY